MTVRAHVRSTLAAAVAAGLLAACGTGGHEPRAVDIANAASMPHPAVPVVAPAPPPWPQADQRALQARLAAALDDPTLRASGIAIVDAAGRPLFERHARHPYVPASTFKLLAAVSALQTFGPDFRFTTELRALDAPDASGRISGDVWLVGSGDPTLTSDDVRAAAGALARGGVRAIGGALVADASAFGGPEVNPAWVADDLQYDYAAGTSALSLDGGTVEVHVTGTTPGAPAIVSSKPAGAVDLLGGVTTSYSTSLDIERAPNVNRFTLSGRVAASAEPVFYRPVTQMALYAARVTRAMFSARGIPVHAGVRTGVAPIGGVVLWTHRSAPLRVILHQMLFDSNNHFAEQLLRAVGAQRGVGTEASGGAVERALLREDAVPQDGLRIVDGSGLAPSDRIAPISEATLLARGAATPIGGTLIDDLPRVGMEGTVRWRPLTDALGRTRAKSGHIENVNSLAGFVQTKHHGRIAFSFMVNDVRADDGPVDGGIDRALDILADQ